MLCREGKISLSSFLLSLTVQVFSVSEYGVKLALLISDSFFLSIFALIAGYFFILIVILIITFRLEDLQVRLHLFLSFVYLQVT